MHIKKKVAASEAEHRQAGVRFCRAASDSGFVVHTPVIIPDAQNCNAFTEYLVTIKKKSGTSLKIKMQSLKEKKGKKLILFFSSRQKK